MKKTVILHEAENFNELDPVLQRNMIISGEDIYRYSTNIEVISDLDGKGWYIAYYVKRPHLSKNGTIYQKTKCVRSSTYKNGKIWGNISLPEMLSILIRHHIEQFCFVSNPDFPSQHLFGYITLPEHVIKSILDGKITSQEDVWKAIANKSYKNKHWKIVRFCKQHNIPVLLLELGCKDWKAILDIKQEIPHVFTELLKKACVVGEKVSCKWSEKHMHEELERMNRTIKFLHVRSKDNTPVYHLSDINIPFTIVNTEQEAFECGEMFHNCVYTNYWNEIKQYKYLVVHDGIYCIGYQIINGGEDLLLDQIRTDHNRPVALEIQREINSLVRPELYKLIRQIPKQIPGELGRAINNGWLEL